MHLLAVFSFKFLQEPLLPVAGTVDLAPCLIMIALLTLGTVLIRWPWVGQAQWLRRTTQAVALLAFVVGLYLCSCLVPDLMKAWRVRLGDSAPLLRTTVFLIVTAAFALAWGRVFCGLARPTGSVQETATKPADLTRQAPDQKPVRSVSTGVPRLAASAIYWFIHPSSERQSLRRAAQMTATLAFVIGLHPCACMVRDLLRGALQINYDTITAFELMMLIIPVAGFAIVWGRVFCGWVCPIGFIQEMTDKLTNWMRRYPDQQRMQYIRFGLAAVLLFGTAGIYTLVKPSNEPILQGMAAGYLIVLSILIVLSVADKRWEARLRTIRYVALTFFVAVTVLDIYGRTAFCVLFKNDWSKEPVLLLVGVLFASLILSQAWCRFLCPEGALLGLLTRLSGWKIRLDRSKCSACNACNQACPVEAIELGKVDERSCLYCCKCVDTCPTEAINMAGEAAEEPSLMPLPVLPRTDG